MKLHLLPVQVSCAAGVCALAIALATAPEIPTIAESGLPGFEASAWDGIFVPAGTAPAIVARIDAAKWALAVQACGAKID